MEGMRFTRNRQNTHSQFGEILAGNPMRPPMSVACADIVVPGRSGSSQVTSDSVSRSDTCRSVLFEIEIPCILLFLNWNNNRQNSPKRMHPHSQVSLEHASVTNNSLLALSSQPPSGSNYTTNYTLNLTLTFTCSCDFSFYRKGDKVMSLLPGK